MENVITEVAQTEHLVYVVDDEAGVRLSVTDMLEDAGYRSWSFVSGSDFLDALDGMEPGCVLLDVQMPGIAGIEVMEHLARRDCDWPVIVMTAHADVPLAVNAMKLGALEFIEKPFSKAVLELALTRGFAGWDEHRRQREVRDQARRRLQVLTAREQSVLQEIAEGKLNKVVAHELGLSVRTVEMHRANLLSKLGLRTPQEAVALIMHARQDFGSGTFSLAS